MCIRDRRVYRELPFTVTIDGQALSDDAASGGKPVLLQGIIDCLWWEEDGWVLLDYKSDHLLERDVPAFIQRYRHQVLLYAQAVARIWKKPVKECYLYMFSLQHYVRITEESSYVALMVSAAAARIIALIIFLRYLLIISRCHLPDIPCKVTEN